VRNFWFLSLSRHQNDLSEAAFQILNSNGQIRSSLFLKMPAPAYPCTILCSVRCKSDFDLICASDLRFFDHIHVRRVRPFEGALILDHASVCKQTLLTFTEGLSYQPSCLNSHSRSDVPECSPMTHSQITHAGNQKPSAADGLGSQTNDASCAAASPSTGAILRTHL